MQQRAAQYLNEIISLSFMGLLIIALIAGQASSAVRASSLQQMAPQAEITSSFRQQGELQ